MSDSNLNEAQQDLNAKEKSVLAVGLVSGCLLIVCIAGLLAGSGVLFTRNIFSDSDVAESEGTITPVAVQKGTVALEPSAADDDDDEPDLSDTDESSQRATRHPRPGT